jgi:MFS family permease
MPVDDATDGGAAVPRWGEYGPGPVRTLALVAFVDAADRGILPGILTRVQDDLGISDTQAGLLGTAFVVTGFLVVLPAGYLADRYRRTRIIALVLASWGAISALNGLVRSYWQFLAVRAALGVGETVDNPSSQSLLADFYPPDVRGRAFAIQRLAPVVGTALGTALAGACAAVLGWRWAFVLVGVPGSLLALRVWRLPEPPRGGNDPAPARPQPDERREGVRAFQDDLRLVAGIRAFRSLVLGLAIALGALAGIGFWLPSFYERQFDLGSGAASGITGGVLLVGALGGTLAGGVLTDRLRRRDASAPMLIAGCAQLVGGLLAVVAFLPVPLALHLPVQLAAVVLISGGLPGLTVTITEVVPARVRGTAFSVNGFIGMLAAALSPLLIGALADLFPVVVDGETKGHLGNAFLAVVWLVPVGALVVLRGRRHIPREVQAPASAPM